MAPLPSSDTLITTSSAAQSSSLLTSSQEHYLKKYLLSRLINKELDTLQRQPYETLPQLGGPFDIDNNHEQSTTPFLRYLFESIVVPFPFLSGSKNALWPKLMLFMDEFAKVDSGNGVEREEMIRRKKLKNRGERTLVLMYSMAIKTTDQREQERKEAARLKASQEEENHNIAKEEDEKASARVDILNSSSNGNHRDDNVPTVTTTTAIVSQEDIVENLRLGRSEYPSHPTLADQPQTLLQVPSQEKTKHGSTAGSVRSRSPSPSRGNLIQGIRINVVGIRVVRQVRHVREHEHSEYIVSSTLADGSEFVVARRHGRFRRLHTNLKRAFPHHDFPLPPAKFASKPVKSANAKSRTASGEKDRISLRAYLHNLARVAPEVVQHEAFVDFLTRDAFTLSAEEASDIEARVRMDEQRAEQQQKFDQEVARKVDELDAQLKDVKKDILLPGGISRLFQAFAQVDNVNNLPPLYQAVFEWGCMSFASTLYHVFTASDDAALNFSQLKRTHFLLPYRTMWGILKVSNPMYMMKSIMDLFLAQPFGSRSLMQRIIAVNIQEEIDEHASDIKKIEAAIDDATLCEKILNYVNAPKAVINSLFDNEELYDITELSLVMDVLKSDKIQPELHASQIQRVWAAQQDLERLKAEVLSRSPALSRHSSLDSSEDDSSDSSSNGSGSPKSSKSATSHQDASLPHAIEHNLISQLQQLLIARLRVRDKERMMALVFQGVTGEILKEMLSIFYQPLVKVYKSANVADSITDVRDFVDELIKIVEQTEANDDSTFSSKGKPSTASLYLGLVRKHLPSFYKFVHSVHKQDDSIFHDLLGWFESIITFMRSGYSWPRMDYKTNEELKATVDLDGLIKTSLESEEWQKIQVEAESLRIYFSNVKDRKREQVRQMAGLDRASRSAASLEGGAGGLDDGSDDGVSEYGSTTSSMQSGSDRLLSEMRGMGLQQEDMDELELVNYDAMDDGSSSGGHDTLEGELGLSVPKVPTIDRLSVPFVELMDQVLFKTARE